MRGRMLGMGEEKEGMDTKGLGCLQPTYVLSCCFFSLETLTHPIQSSSGVTLGILPLLFLPGVIIGPVTCSFLIHGTWQGTEHAGGQSPCLLSDSHLGGSLEASP